MHDIFTYYLYNTINGSIILTFKLIIKQKTNINKIKLTEKKEKKNWMWKSRSYPSYCKSSRVYNWFNSKFQDATG